MKNIPFKLVHWVSAAVCCQNPKNLHCVFFRTRIQPMMTLRFEIKNFIERQSELLAKTYPVMVKTEWCCFIFRNFGREG